MWGPVLRVCGELTPTRQSSSNALQGHYFTPLGKQAPVTPAQVPVHSTLCSTFLAMGSNIAMESFEAIAKQVVGVELGARRSAQFGPPDALRASTRQGVRVASIRIDHESG